MSDEGNNFPSLDEIAELHRKALGVGNTELLSVTEAAAFHTALAISASEEAKVLADFTRKVLAPK